LVNHFDFETLELLVKALIAKANERGGPDNVAAQIVWVADPSPRVSVSVPMAAPRSATSAQARTRRLITAVAVVAGLIALALALYRLRSADSRVAGFHPAPDRRD
jgi:hypothetical protein